jgi:hypothetical protein
LVVNIRHQRVTALHFFFPLALALALPLVLAWAFALPLDALPPALELLDSTLDARDGDVDVALLAVADLTLSSALFWCSR